MPDCILGCKASLAGAIRIDETKLIPSLQFKYLANKDDLPLQTRCRCQRGNFAARVGQWGSYKRIARWKNKCGERWLNGARQPNCQE
jgi:hypothetical protein